MNHLEQTLQFRKSAVLPVSDAQTTPSISDRKLNLALLLEEVSELAEAYGLEETFYQLMQARCGFESFKGTSAEWIDRGHLDTNEYNAVEALDAMADIQVILDGTVLTSGFQGVMADALTAVFNSNMTKFVTDIHDAAMESVAYSAKGIEIEWGAVAIGQYALRRRSDGKLLKPKTFVAPNLSQFIKNQ